MGMDFRSVPPKDLQPDQELLSTAIEIARETGAKITITEDIDSGVKGCDFLCTDVWVSMGEAEEVWKERITQLPPIRLIVR